VKPDPKLKNTRSTLDLGELDDIAMSIDANAALHLMDVLTKLYPDAEEASIREYSTNAWDSHVSAGVTRPIEVTLPTPLKPELVIQDFGLGLDRTDIVEVYSKYGASTKRESNEFNGQLGLGCKAALAYGDSFTVSGIKDGMLTTVLVTRNADGMPTMKIVDESTTTEGNGVTVRIPAKQGHEFEMKARRFFSFWPEGQALIDGEPPKRIGTEELINDFTDLDEADAGALWLDDHVLLTAQVDEDLVVMGNVAYPLTSDQVKLFDTGNTSNRRYVNGRYVYGNPFHAVCFVPIGAVNFTPARDQLQDTKRTRQTLDKLRAHIAAKRDEAVEANIAASGSAREAVQRWSLGRALGYKGEPVYKGRKVLRNLTRYALDANGDPKILDSSADTDYTLKHSYLNVNSTGYTKKSGERSQQINLDTLSGDAYVFTGFDGKVLTQTKRIKLELWWAANGPKRVDVPDRTKPMPHIILVDTLSDTERFWLDGLTIKSWADVHAVKIPENTTADGGTTRLKGSYDILHKDRVSEGAPAASIDQSLPVYYLHGNKWSIQNHRAFRTGVLDSNKCTVVALSSNRIDKFKRDFPKAIDLDTAARKAAERWLKTANKEAREAYSAQRAIDSGVVKSLNADDLDDPDLKKLVTLLRKDVRTYVEQVSKYGHFLADGLKDMKVYRWSLTTLEKYPILSDLRYGVSNKRHIVIYLNAAYQAEKGV